MSYSELDTLGFSPLSAYTEYLVAAAVGNLSRMLAFVGEDYSLALYADIKNYDSNFPVDLSVVAWNLSGDESELAVESVECFRPALTGSVVIRKINGRWLVIRETLWNVEIDS
jgi:hypothetical protein